MGTVVDGGYRCVIVPDDIGAHDIMRELGCRPEHMRYLKQSDNSA